MKINPSSKSHTRNTNNKAENRVTWADVHDFSHAKDVVRIGGLYDGEGADPNFYATAKQMVGIRTIARRRNNIIALASGMGMGLVSTLQSGSPLIGAATGLAVGGLVRLVSKDFTIEGGGGMYVHEALEYLNTPLNRKLQWGQP